MLADMDGDDGQPTSVAAPSWGPATRVLLVGHTGLVGGAVLHRLQAAGYQNVILRSIEDIDLTDGAATRALFESEQPQAVIVAAAKVGGILANWKQPYEFVAVNLAIELNVVGAAFESGVQRLVFLGSSCIYPRLAPQPLKEECLLTGPLEETNRPYAIAKIAGVELCRSLNREYGTDYLSLMPTNLYGPGDNFDLTSSHVLPAMIRKFHEALPDRPVSLWGSGTPRREFLHVDDLADAVVFLFENAHAADVPDGLVNVGSGEDQTVRELAELVQRVVGHRGPIEWDASKPDGTPRKLLDVTRLRALSWRPAISLEDGIRSTYEWFLANVANGG